MESYAVAESFFSKSFGSTTSGGLSPEVEVLDVGVGGWRDGGQSPTAWSL